MVWSVQLLLVITTALDIISLVSINAPILFRFEGLPELTSNSTTAELNRFQLMWNDVIDGLHSIDTAFLWNILLLIKLGMRLCLFITLPLMIIGNRAGRSSYLEPFKYFQLLVFLFSISISLYFFFSYTTVSFLKNAFEILNWSHLFSNPFCAWLAWTVQHSSDMVARLLSKPDCVRWSTVCQTVVSVHIERLWPTVVSLHVASFVFD